jgi:hypothetical protein
MALLSSAEGWALADALGCSLSFNEDTGSIDGSMTKEIMIGGSPIGVPLKVVSSRVGDNATMIIVRVIGNLSALLVVKRVQEKAIVDFHVLNMAKMDAVTNWLEKRRPKSVNDALEKLGTAVVASFTKIDKQPWKKV